MKLNGLSRGANLLAASLKSVVKMAVLARGSSVGSRDMSESSTLIILGNGPSLKDTIVDYPGQLASHPLLAVNFAANTPEFLKLRPRYYVLVDPAFFCDTPADNVVNLWKNLSELTDWRMTLFVPARSVGKVPAKVRERVEVRKFNDVGVEGYAWLRHMAYRRGWGMPRPRNVLIPSIMIGMQLGFPRIMLTGADHSWTKTLGVNSRNEVVSIQPHYYEDDKKELDRVAAIYRNVKLHEIMYSFHVAFRSYFDIVAYARRRGVAIINATPDSFIDAFPRGSLGDI